VVLWTLITDELYGGWTDKRR